jgi:hypothetical protein
LSVGGDVSTTACPEDPAADVIEALTAASVPVVVASGNDGYYNAISHPACVSDAIAVASVNEDDEISLFANTSATLDLLAPGENVISAVPGSSYASFDGTSMAAPHVAGAFALLRQEFPTADVEHLRVALRKGGHAVFDPYGQLTFKRLDIGGAIDSYTDDITKPAVTRGYLPALTLASHVHLTWSATDDSGSVTDFDVLKKGLNWDGSTTPWITALSGTAMTSVDAGTTPGWTKCYRVRARDAARNQSLWTDPRCVASPLDDRRLAVRTSGWTDGTSTTRYRGTMRSAWAPGRQLSLSHVYAKRIWLVATKCAECGVVVVLWNGQLVKVIDLAAKTTQHRQVIGVAAFTGTRSGTIDVVTLDAGIVSIDGLGISRV